MHARRSRTFRRTLFLALFLIVSTVAAGGLLFDGVGAPGPTALERADSNQHIAAYIWGEQASETQIAAYIWGEISVEQVEPERTRS